MHQNPPSSSTNPPTLNDIPTTLTTLKNLINLSQTAITSISILLPTKTTTTTTATNTATCPFNPHHHLPPESLFRHFLQCPSSPTPLDLSLLQSLHYPKTLQSSPHQNPFTQTLHEHPTTDLCFSLDHHYSKFHPNFFYKDCPAVFATSSNQDNPIPMFSLPGVLSVECSNFMGSEGKYINGFDRNCIRLLPSEIWVVRREIEAWNEYPSYYSYTVLRTILCSKTNEFHDLMRWFIVNSPRYGVVIDVPMRDHISLVFRLCFKSITREAMGLTDSLFNREVELGLKSMNFKCPVLVQVLVWLGSQLSVLYGEVNGKLFALNMIKQWLFNSSWNCSLYPMEQKDTKSPPLEGVDNTPLEKINENVKNDVAGETSIDSGIFVSQVAAAVAALHERALLEDKIKSLWNSQPLPAYQRIAEHSSISKRAEEERQKRANYKPILEHDGLLWQHSHNQATNKMKTREQLLAEERDYKRRRMSYRGKKLKRNTTQVMRDIIDEYMERIKHAGGIGCLPKGAEESDMLADKPLSVHDDSGDVDELKKSLPDSFEVGRETPHGYRKQLHSHRNIRSTEFGSEHPEDKKRHVRDSNWHHGPLETPRNMDRERHDREYFSRSPDRRWSSGYSHEKIRNRGQRDDVEVSRKYLSRSPVRSHSRSHERNSHQRDRVDQISEFKERKQRNRYTSHRSESAIYHELEDRYDPSESCDMHDDGIYSSSKYVGQD